MHRRDPNDPLVIITEYRSEIRKLRARVRGNRKQLNDLLAGKGKLQEDVRSREIDRFAGLVVTDENRIKHLENLCLEIRRKT